MFMNAEDSVTNVRDLLNNFGDDNNTVFFRTFNEDGDDIFEVEKSPTKMSGWLYENKDLIDGDSLYITIDPFSSGVHIILSTYER